MLLFRCVKRRRQRMRVSRFLLPFMSPLTTDIALRIPYQDCDMHQTVRAAAYLRYMQEAAFAGSAAAGYTNERYQAMQRVWLIRENHLEFLAPLHYSAGLCLKTWVADFRRVRSQRVYEMWTHGAGEEHLAARGLTDWVFVDTHTGQPAPVPLEMIASFLPYTQTAGGPERIRFPAQKPPAAGIHISQRRVPWRELDSVGHVNNAVYGDYIEDALYEYLAALGWLPARLTEAGLAFAPQSLHIEYRQPAWFGDVLTVTTWLDQGHAAGFVCHSVVQRAADHELLAQAFAAWHSVDAATRAPCPLPADLLSILP